VGACGPGHLRVGLGRGQEADAGVAAPAVVEDFHVLEERPPGASRLGKLVRCTSSFLRLPKKLSIGALSRQSPLRLMDWMIPCRASIAR
jgi:hypothetical protein